MVIVNASLYEFILGNFSLKRDYEVVCRVRMQGTPFPTAPAVRIRAAYSMPRVQGVLHRSHTSEVTNFMDTRSLSLFNAGAFFPFAFAIPDSPFPQVLTNVVHHMGIRPVWCQSCTTIPT
ncbi:hypothetical protein [Paenibacillus sp. FSL K6-2862]|uniref:hypothetical protein n=1 Tax=Paenibacillus sp. FSL K6-2862 TaxID=2921484 RepID=UPI0030F76645